MKLPQKSSFESFHAKFLKTNVYHYYRESLSNIYTKFMQQPQKN